MAGRNSKLEDESRYDQLTDQYRLFVDCYIDRNRANFNQTEAAKQAGYSPDSAVNQGYRLMRNDEIREAIREKLNDSAMSAEEALNRLAAMARGDVSPFMSADDKGNVRINLGTKEAELNYNLIRKVKQTRHITKVEDISSEEIKTDIELHDAKDALIQILKMHGKFVERMDITSGDEPINTIKLVEVRRDDAGDS